MSDKIKNIQKMMRNLVINAVDKFNESKIERSEYNDGIASAYGWILAGFCDKAKRCQIPLNYFSLHDVDLEAAFFFNKILCFDKKVPIPSVKKKYKSMLIVCLNESKLLIKQYYKQHLECLEEAPEDKFYQAVVEGYREIVSLMEQYNIKIKI